MATQEYYEPSLLNGESKNFEAYMRRISGGVNKAWAAGVTGWMILVGIMGPLIINGWILVPAKERDLQEVKTAVVQLNTTVRGIADHLIRVEEVGRGYQKEIDALTNKLDRIIDHWSFAPPAAPAAVTPSQAERNKRLKRNSEND